jgi:hypothetical protein
VQCHNGQDDDDKSSVHGSQLAVNDALRQVLML